MQLEVKELEYKEEITHKLLTTNQYNNEYVVMKHNMA